METSEIFANISTHQVAGMMFHEQLSNYFDFLGLRGYQKCQEYHYLCETIEHRKTNKYYINNTNYLIHMNDVENPEALPTNWFKYNRHEVDNNTRKNAIKDAFQLWRKWELDTKELYETAYKNLIDLNEISLALKVKRLIESVSEELECLNGHILELKSVDYSLDVIISMQTDIYNKYKYKLEHELELDMR